MKVIYVGHCGFLAETEKAWYLFDYIRGDIPELEPGKPLYVFVSHSHADHFSREIFSVPFSEHVSAYVLGCDIRKKFRRSGAGWLTRYEDRIVFAEPGKEIMLPSAKILPLKSTDIGVAYVVEEEHVCLYHAGDLNWWHWEGEPKAWNRNMEVNYKREIDRLRGKRIDAAFVTLDPRLEEAYWYGMDYFLRAVSAKAVFPMHFWEDYSVIPRYVSEHGHGDQIMKITREGQEFLLEC